MNNLTLPYEDGDTFGVGVNSANGDRMQLGAKGNPTTVPGMSGGSGSFQLTRIQQTSDLEEALGISADVSVGCAWCGASDRFDFARQCKIQEKSICLMLSCTWLKGFTQIEQPVLDEGAASLVASGQTELFSERYGDYFVAGMNSGGQFFGVIRIDVKSDSVHEQIENQLSGTYGTVSGDLNTTFNSLMTATESKAFVYVYYQGGTILQSKPQTPEELFVASNEWSKGVEAAPLPYSALLLPWVKANGPTPPNAADLRHQRDVLKTCTKLRSQVIDRMNLLEYIQDPLHITEFVSPDFKKISDLYKKISADSDLIAEAASYAIDNAKGALEPENYAQMIKNLPGYRLTVFGEDDLPKRVAGGVISVPAAANSSQTTGGKFSEVSDMKRLNLRLK